MRVAGTARAMSVNLTDAEATELAELAADGDTEAREELVHSFMGLALSIAGAYHRRSRWSVDKVQLEGAAMETLLRYGVDGYRPMPNIPVRTWVALTIRRKLAGIVIRAEKQAEGLQRYVEELSPRDKETFSMPYAEPHGPDAATELERILTWAEREEMLTAQQVSILALRGKGELFGAIGERLGIHRKKASREHAAAMDILHEAVARGQL